MKHSLFALLLLFTVPVFTQEYHDINISLNIRPYTANREIEADVLVNHVIRATLPSDNTSFAHIRGRIPKQPGDSIIQVAIVIRKPSNYITVESSMPFTYYAGLPRSVRIVERNWGKQNGWVLGQQAAKLDPDSAIIVLNGLLSERLFNSVAEEVKLTQLLSDSYAKAGYSEKSFDYLSSISSNKLQALDTTQQKKYFQKLYMLFGQNYLSDSIKHIDGHQLAAAMRQNDTISLKWLELNNKVLTTPVGKKLDKAVFMAENIRDGNVISQQFKELDKKILQ